MEITFMTIHNLTPDANVLFVSDSIVDVLGYQPQEVVGRSCFDYFHPEEVPFARYIHSRGVELDKAAVLHYARIKGRDGQYVGCECVFTIVYDVLVACTSIYQQGMKSERRALEAPTIRKLFASSPRDPRYHMLEHLSAKFKTPATQVAAREPRAALILNRFTRTLTVMYATTSIASILGIEPEDIKDKSFYECIAEECLDEAVRCLESAKANDSIAYLRFKYHDPRSTIQQQGTDQDSSDSEDGGAELQSPMEVDSGRESSPKSNQISSSDETTIIHSGSSSSARTGNSSSQETYGVSLGQNSSSSASSYARPPLEAASPRDSQSSGDTTIELEAVVSCTSDGLVVILRRARPIVPLAGGSSPSSSGVFAAPWGADPTARQTSVPQHTTFMDDQATSQQAASIPSGPPIDHLMNTIRDVAVFAWSLTGINGNIADYARGVPRGEAVPSSGYPIWDRHYAEGSYQGPENQAQQRWLELNTAQWQHPRFQQLPGLSYGYGHIARPEGMGYYPYPWQQPQFVPYSNNYTNHHGQYLNHEQNQYNGGNFGSNGHDNIHGDPQYRHG